MPSSSALLGAGDRFQLPVQALDHRLVALVLEQVGAGIGVVLVHARKLAVPPVGAQRAQLTLDALALAGQQLSCSLGFHVQRGLADGGPYVIACSGAVALEQLAQDVLEDAAVTVVEPLLRRVDAHRPFELRPPRRRPCGRSPSSCARRRRPRPTS